MKKLAERILESDDGRFRAHLHLDGQSVRRLLYPCPVYEGETCGANIYPWIGDRMHEWKMTGDVDRPTLKPDIRCLCGWRGWIRDGEIITRPDSPGPI